MPNFEVEVAHAKVHNTSAKGDSRVPGEISPSDTRRLEEEYRQFGARLSPSDWRDLRKKNTGK